MAFFKKQSLFISFLILAGLFFCLPAFGATRTWSGTTNGNWNVDANWGGTKPSAGDDLVFPASASNKSTTNDIAADTSFNSITFDGDGYTLSGNRITLVAGITQSVTSTNIISLAIILGADQIVDMQNSGGTLTISGIISNGAGDALSKIGTGALTLSGANTFTGGLTIKAGTVNGTTSANAFGGSGTGVITLGDTSGSASATLKSVGTGFEPTFANPITVASGSSGTLTIIAQGCIFGGAISLNNNVTFTGVNGYFSYFQGGITGTGNIIISSVGNSASTFSTASVNNTGTITNSGSGTGITTISAVIGTNVSGIIQNSATSKLVLSGNNSTIGDVTITSGILELSGTTNLNVTGDFINSVGLAGFTANTSTVTLTGTTQTLSGTTTFNNLTIDKTNTPTISFTSGETTTISGNFTSTGDATHQITIGATTTSAATLSKTTGTVTCSYCTISYSTATGGATFNAVTSSGNINGGNNTGWLFDVADAYWVGGTGNWSDAANHWAISSGGVAGAGNLPGANSNVYFDTSSCSGACTVTIDSAGVTVANFNETDSADTTIATSTNGITITGDLTVNKTISGATAITLNSSSKTITGGGNGEISSPVVLGATHTVDVATGTFTMSGIISDGGNAYGISKTGANTLTLSGANTFTGGLTIKAGTVQLDTSATAAGTGTITIGDSSGSADARLSVLGNGITFANPITVASGSSGLLRITSDLYNYTLSGNITLNNDLTVVVANINQTIFAGIISGTGKLTVNSTSSGPLSLSAANTFTGGLTIKSGNVRATNGGSGSAFGGSGTGAITIGDTSGSASATLNGYNATYANPVTVASGSSGTLSIGGISNNGAGVFSGAIALNNNLTITSSSGYGLTLSGAISGSGNITIIATTTGSVTLSTASVNHTGTIINSGTGTGTTTISGVIGANVSGVIQNSATSQLTLSGDNTYTGTTTITSGTLSADEIVVSGGHSAIGNATSAVILGGAATSGTLYSTQGITTYTRGFTVNAGGGEIDNSTGTLTIETGGITANGPLTLGRTGAITVSAIIANGATPGSIVKVGTTTLTLTGVNTFTGGLTIKAGTVQGTSSSAFGGSGTGTITIGDTSGSADATLASNTYSSPTYANPITVASGSSGILMIKNLIDGGCTFSAAVTLSNNLTIQSFEYGGQVTLSGGVSGAGNVILNATGTNGNIYVTTAPINNSGTITNSGTGTGTTTISAVIGTAVTGVIQNSATSKLVLSGNNSTVGDVTITSGTLELSGSTNLNVTGDWSNSGTFTANTSTVTLTGTTQTISGANTFYNLTKDVSATAADTLTFTAGSVQTIASGGVVTLKGAVGKVLTIVSATPGTRWVLISPAGTTYVIDYVNVTDSDASRGNPINATNSTNSGNNLNWGFGIIIAPVPSGFNPASGATITSTPTITFVLDMSGDCRAATSDLGYDDMASSVNCAGDGTTNGTCQMNNLGSNGSKTIYISCKGIFDNKDTAGTNHSVTYTLNTTASGSTKSIIISGDLKVKGKMKFTGSVCASIYAPSGAGWTKIADTLVRDITGAYDSTIAKDIYCDGDDTAGGNCILWTDGATAPGTVCIATDANVYANLLWDRKDIATTQTWADSNFSISGGDIGGTHTTNRVGNNQLAIGTKNWLERDYTSPAGTFNAMDACKAKGLGWRMPNILELDSIRDQAKGSAPYSRLPNIVSNFYWSSSELSSTTPFRLYFSSGYASTTNAKGGANRVRCVRGAM